MADTGILGKSTASLDNFVLGETADGAAAILKTPGLIAFFKCDDNIFGPYHDVFGHHGKAYRSTSTTNPWTDQGTIWNQATDVRINDPYNAGLRHRFGVSDYAYETPPAIIPVTSNTYFSKDPNSHITIKTDPKQPLFLTRGEGSIEVWFQPHEWGDELQIDSGLHITYPKTYYDIVRLRNNNHSIALRSTVSNPSGANTIAVNYNYIRSSDGFPSVFDSDDQLAYHGIVSGDASNPYYPIPNLVTRRWYQLVIAWDNTTITAYVNGRQVWDSYTESASYPPPYAGDMIYYDRDGNVWTNPTLQNPTFYQFGRGWTFEFGECGGAYDLVQVYDRKITGAEVGLHYAAVVPSAAFGVKATSIFATYASTITRQARITKYLSETLYKSAGNQARVSKFYIETLRSVSFDDAIHRNVGQTLTFTETTDGHIRTPITENITQTLVLHDHATPNLSKYDQHLSQTLTFNETLVETVSKHGDDELDFTETVDIKKVFGRSVVQTLVFNQLVSQNGTHNLSVNQTLVLTDTSTAPTDVLQILTYNETINGYVDHPTFDTLHFTETLVFQKNVRTVSAESDLTYTQTAWINGPNAFNIPSAILSNESLGDILLADYNDFSYNTSVLTFDQTVSLDKIRGPHVNDLLVFNQTVGIQRIYSRSITQHLDFIDGDISRRLNILINGEYVVYTEPVAFVSLIKHGHKIVTYQSKKGIITLPAPEWGDTEGLGNEVRVKRSMTGKVYTYIKTSKRSSLKYDFTITRKKAYELRLFLENNLTEVITLHNWKGQVYVGQFLVNPTTLTYAGRYANSYEKVTVTLEFEGVRVHG